MKTLGRPNVYLAAARLTETNASLLAAMHCLDLEAEWLPAKEIGSPLAGDVILGRFDVRSTLDGVEPGIWDLLRAERNGVRVVNGAQALLLSHDKLASAFRLRRAGVPHPRTAHVGGQDEHPPLPTPVVLKPRFGTWGRDVFLAESASEYRCRLKQVRARPWFRRHGVLVQGLVPPRGFDVRVVVAGGRVVGAVERWAADGEWRTNVALGGMRRRTIPDARAVELALVAARAVGGDLVGVDLLPCGRDDYVVLEVNGAVDFTDEYALDGRDVFETAILAFADATRFWPRRKRGFPGEVFDWASPAANETIARAGLGELNRSPAARPPTTS